MEIACLSEGAVLWMCSLFVQRQSAAVQVVGYCLALFWSVLCSPVRLAPPQHVDFCVYLPMPMRVMCMGLCAHAREHRVLMSRHAQMHTRTCIICSPRALPTLRIAHFVARLAYCTFDLASFAHLLHCAQLAHFKLRASRTAHLSHYTFDASHSLHCVPRSPGAWHLARCASRASAHPASHAWRSVAWRRVHIAHCTPSK